MIFMQMVISMQVAAILDFFYESSQFSFTVHIYKIDSKVLLALFISLWVSQLHLTYILYSLKKNYWMNEKIPCSRCCKVKSHRWIILQPFYICSLCMYNMKSMSLFRMNENSVIEQGLHCAASWPRNILVHSMIFIEIVYFMKQSHQQKYFQNYEESWSGCTFSGYVLHRFFSIFINKARVGRVGKLVCCIGLQYKVCDWLVPQPLCKCVKVVLQW